MALHWLLPVMLVLGAGCSTHRSRIRSGMEHDKWAIFEQTIEESEGRKRNFQAALERLKKRVGAPRIVPPIVKLHPAREASNEEIQTVADSRDEWMHLYYRGLSHIAEADYDRAISDFKSFLQSDRDHVYGDRANYWIVESYYRNREYGLCVLSANEFLKRYGESLKSPEVLYRRGLALGSMGQSGPARETLRELLRRFPKSSVSEGATAQLARLSVKELG